MHAIHLTAFGNPAEGLEFVQIPEPASPGAGQALIGVEFSPIDLSDLLVASGLTPFAQACRASLATRAWSPNPGRRVRRVENVAVGDQRPDAAPHGLAWARRIVAPGGRAVRAAPADVDPQQLAMLTINPPTAGLLLEVSSPISPPATGSSRTPPIRA